MQGHLGWRLEAALPGWAVPAVSAVGVIGAIVTTGVSPGCWLSQGCPG